LFSGGMPLTPLNQKQNFLMREKSSTNYSALILATNLPKEGNNYLF
jgi:hypothetical protein